MVVKPQCMLVKPQNIYMEVTHLIERKQVKAIHTIKLQIQQKLKPYTLSTISLAKLEMKTTL